MILSVAELLTHPVYEFTKIDYDTTVNFRFNDTLYTSGQEKVDTSNDYFLLPRGLYTSGQEKVVVIFDFVVKPDVHCIFAI